MPRSARSPSARRLAPRGSRRRCGALSVSISRPGRADLGEPPTEQALPSAGGIGRWLVVLSPLREAGWEDDAVIAWLHEPRSDLGGRGALQALVDGDESLVVDEVAATLGHAA